MGPNSGLSRSRHGICALAALLFAALVAVDLAVRAPLPAGAAPPEPRELPDPLHVALTADGFVPARITVVLDRRSADEPDDPGLAEPADRHPPRHRHHRPARRRRTARPRRRDPPRRPKDPAPPPARLLTRVSGKRRRRDGSSGHRTARPMTSLSHSHTAAT